MSSNAQAAASAPRGSWPAAAGTRKHRLPLPAPGIGVAGLLATDLRG